MADLDDRTLVDAGLGLLRADRGLVVYPDAEGVVPAAPEPPYVVVHSYVERPAADESHGLDGRSSAATVRWYCHAVGATEPASLAVAMRVRAALLDQRVTVPGWSTGLIRQEAAQPPGRDEAASTPVYTAAVVYVLAATANT